MEFLVLYVSPTPERKSKLRIEIVVEDNISRFKDG